ncbi:response regulator transcription factor [Limosilactobacillus antri]|uniref:Transcriptional regulatory protein, C-terminal domain protein n=1 Tax=Limosilactobacillus antri DSM 16041 TaxID=525309 RepID=C8P580_9LACO|nr:response regulator transcription factor [Limosilactobacillus antri]EEW54291.1 transcriptional regulatory protein, C-terminal domain protein [Limosilactobacillus antri DSM 16041]KRK59965.1 hypothetical protein FC31_GL000240 [Limosilactobacillus antri DSM 16041]
MAKEFLLMSRSADLVDQLTASCKKARWQLTQITTPTGLVVALEQRPVAGVWWDLSQVSLDTTIATMTLIRQQLTGPIMVLAPELTDRIQRKLFSAQVDDVIPLPVEERGFRARVSQRLWLYRHVKFATATTPREPAPTAVIATSDWTIDQANYTVKKAGQPVELTPKEFQLLSYLINHHNQVLSREQLVSGVWGYDLLASSRIVDIHISHLRDKLEDDPHKPAHLLTVRGFGYKFV